MEIAGLVIALISLGLLINQEVRRYRDRPYGRINAAATGWINRENGERWDVIEVTNVGTVTAVIDLQHWFGIEQITSIEDSTSLDLKIPKNMKPGDHVRIPVKGDLDAGWLRIMTHAPGKDTMEIEWLPLNDGPLEEIAHTQWEIMVAQHRARRRPRFWTRNYWVNERRWVPAPVAPVPEGRNRVRFTERRKKRFPDMIKTITSADDRFFGTGQEVDG